MKRGHDPSPKALRCCSTDRLTIRSLDGKHLVILRVIQITDSIIKYEACNTPLRSGIPGLGYGLAGKTGFQKVDADSRRKAKLVTPSICPFRRFLCCDFQVRNCDARMSAY
jgi:hypothetical protein